MTAKKPYELKPITPEEFEKLKFIKLTPFREITEQFLANNHDVMEVVIPEDETRRYYECLGYHARRKNYAFLVRRRGNRIFLLKRKPNMEEQE